MPDMENIEFARENERFADELDLNEEPSKNWAVIIRFYSYLHFVEEKLKIYKYTSKKHSERNDNITECRQIDNRARTIYRLLEDLSKDARYRCIRMDDEDVQKSESKLEEGKNVLGYQDGGSSHKYSI